jgi:hypothetical protein
VVQDPYLWVENVGLFGLSKSCLDHLTNAERTKDFTFLLPGQDNKYFTSVVWKRGMWHQSCRWLSPLKVLDRFRISWALMLSGRPDRNISANTHRRKRKMRQPLCETCTSAANPTSLSITDLCAQLHVHYDHPIAVGFL